MDLSDMINDAILQSEFDIECPNCNKEFTVEVSQVGSTVQCPFCEVAIELKDNF